MKYIIIGLIITQSSWCMDYKRAVLQDNTDHGALLKRPNKADKPATATPATPEEQQEIIDELSPLQSRPQLIVPRVDTTRVNAIINERFFRNSRYHTKTEIAISIDSPEARQWLLDRLSSSQQSFHEAVQTLHQFILNNDTDHARTLLEWTALDANGNSCLVRKNNNVSLAHQAINNPEMLEIVLNAGANPDAFDNNRFTPLHRAAMLGNAQSVKVLLTAGAKPTIKTDNPSASSMFDTPLLCAV